jgi:2-amino-4-hydroxy-6-hydroxymethyldihydropteridine diphosphokinase
MRYFLSLGTNLGNRKKNLALAISLLEERGVDVLRASSVYRTEPVDIPDQPWFYNQVLEVDAEFTPLALLNLVKSIEHKLKRIPNADKGPRTIDIDILLAGKTVIQTRRLMIPHPKMARRNFVLVPLREIAPNAVHPLLHERVVDMMKASADSSVVRKLKSGQVRRRDAKPAIRETDPLCPRVHSA